MHYPGHRFALTMFASVIAVWLVVMFALMRASVLPASAEGIMLVVFEPGIADDAAFAAITAPKPSPFAKRRLVLSGWWKAMRAS